MPKTSISSLAPGLSGPLLGLCLAVLATTQGVAAAALAKGPADLVGQWDVTRDQDPRHCRITLNAEQSSRGAYFVGVPVPCRRLMPTIAKIGYWGLSDPAHLALSDRAGRPVLDLAADGDAFRGQGVDGSTYRLVFLPAAGRNATDVDPVADLSDNGPPPVIRLQASNQTPAAGQTQASLAASGARKAKGVAERPSDLAGRYAILRDKTHDTGCMLTLDDKTRAKGGDRAALAPACRDQGIVVFDPTAWQLINGRLVLTAKAGHTTHLDRQDDGSWLKDPAEGKSLTLKKL